MINKKLIKALKELNIPVLYATRGNKTTFPLVVFNFIESLSTMEILKVN